MYIPCLNCNGYVNVINTMGRNSILNFTLELSDIFPLLGDGHIAPYMTILVV